MVTARRTRVAPVQTERLAAVPLFADLPAAELAAVSAVADEVEVAEGSAVIVEGDFGHAVFAVESGTAEVISDGVTIRTVGPGDVVGEIAVLASGRRTASVVATSPMRLISLFKRDVWALERDGGGAPAARADRRARRPGDVLVPSGNHDEPERNAVDAPRLAVRGVELLDERLAAARSDGDDHLVGRERRERIPDRERDVRLPGRGLDVPRGQLVRGLAGDLFRVGEGTLVVGQPVEKALLDDGHDDLHPVGRSNRVAQRRLLVLDRADDEDVARHVSGA
jgi:CRP/FNR family cyclic AMP-dependent transcriptional regulator